MVVVCGVSWEKKEKKNLSVEETDSLGLMSQCTGTFLQPLIMSDQLGEKMAS